MKTSRRFRALLWFLFWCGFLSLAFTRAYWIADSLLLAALVITFVVFNVAKVHQLWKHRSDPEMREAIASSGQGGVFKSLQRWAADDDSERK
jgi:steroid 5-alpha reductase family enzyme